MVLVGAILVMMIEQGGDGAERMRAYMICQLETIIASREKAYKGFKYDLAARPMKSASMEPQRARVYKARAR